MEKSRKSKHYKQISMSYPTVSEGQSTISIEKGGHNSVEFYFNSNSNSAFEEDIKDYDHIESDSNFIINQENLKFTSNPDQLDRIFDKKKEKALDENFQSSQKYLSVKKSRLHKEYSSDGDVTDHENMDTKSNVTNSAFSDREIKNLFYPNGITSDKSSQDNLPISSKPSNKNLYLHIVKNMNMKCLN